MDAPTIWLMTVGLLGFSSGALTFWLLRTKPEADAVPRVQFEAVSGELSVARAQVTEARTRYTVPLRVAEAAKVLTATASALDAGGEYKRHQVYAALIQRFPETPKRDLALAIELALR